MKIHFLLILSIAIILSCNVDTSETNNDAQEQSKVEEENPVFKEDNTGNETEAAPAKVKEPEEKEDVELISKSAKSKLEESESNHAANAKINIEVFNEKYLISLVRNGINKIRSQKGAPILRLNEVLNNAARDHNVYQIKKDKLTHTQNNPRKYEAMDRVKRYGGGFRMVGENVQYQGLAQLTTGNHVEIVSETYGEMAEKLIKNWVDSPGHYENLIEHEFTEDGMAIGWNPENYAFFATHVFGSQK